MKRLLVAVAMVLVLNMSARAELKISKVELVDAPWSIKHSSNAYYAVDVLCLRFAAHGMKTDKQHRLDLDISIKLVDAKGETLIRENGPHMDGEPLLGTKSLTMYAGLQLQGVVPPGGYTAVLVVRDNVSEQTAKFQHTITIKPVEFAIVYPHLSRDRDDQIEAGIYSTSLEPLWLHVGVIGFDFSRGFVDERVKVQIIDATTGRPAGPPQELALHQDIPQGNNSKMMVCHVQIGLTRPGKFIMQAAVTDEFLGKTARVEMPLEVFEP